MKNFIRIFMIITGLIIGSAYVSAQNAGNNPQRTGNMPVRTMHIDSMSLSDPYILPDPVTKTYYMTSSGSIQCSAQGLPCSCSR